MASPSEHDAPAVDFGDNVDQTTFDQILEMDDDEDQSHEFSSGIVFDFLQQAEQTFENMETLIIEKDMPALSGQGHFLKGSSATLGFVHIRDACEKIQNYGLLKNEDGNGHLEEDTALKLIKESVQDAKEAYDIIRILMYKFFDRDA